MHLGPVRRGGDKSWSQTTISRRYWIGSHRDQNEAYEHDGHERPHGLETLALHGAVRGKSGGQGSFTVP